MSEAPVNKISLKGVTKRFGPKVVLDGIDLDIPAGQSTVIIGGSGTGKSVMLKCILGLMEPDRGTIAIDGADTTRARGKARETVMAKVGMLFQGGALFDSLKVWQNVAFALIQAEKMAPAKAREIAIEKLAAVGLSADVADLFPAELSGGMQKRVGLARAIAREPEILFFDEPTTGLDPIMSDVINGLIRKCVQDLGATAVTITHDMHSVRRIADHVAMLYQGKLIWKGPVGDMDNEGNPYLSQFINGRSKGPIQMQVRG
ncbi:ABC transporter ATP-binding protein [Lacibacterium aquatile]|uniref:ABC transporter ATP-binding protein n=1 Tax=Lacibacterium aquatile TaxID=1168082 RepID=A0ABW5DNR7_9PROT